MTTDLIVELVKNGNSSGDSIIKTLNKNYGISEPSIKSTITRLVQSEKLVRVGRGEYAVVPDKKQIFQVAVGEQEKDIFSLISSMFPFAKLCVYNGKTLSPLQHHLSVNNITYVEVSKEAVESVFECIKRRGYQVYLSPNLEFINRYVDMTSNSVIVKPLITEAPVETVDGVCVPKLEKLLIDIRCDDDYEYLRGLETDNMLLVAKSLYVINSSKMRRYGKRRGINL